jgi:hypothetical protein
MVCGYEGARLREFRCLLVAGLALLAVPFSSAAQQAMPSAVAIETVAAIDESVDESGNFVTGVIFDSVISVDMGRGLEGIVRPFVQRMSSSGEWNRQVWVAALRYERTGNIGVRIDAGLIPPPVGLANLMLRPHLNPTISHPASLYSSLPPVMSRGPRANLLGGIYPYGAHATISGSHWDARAAVIDTSPLRSRRVFAETNPPRFANVVVGGGVTPFVGLRLGTSVTHGGWQRAGESPAITEDLSATVVTVESELSFRHTKLMGEWVRDSIETSSGDVVASGWFVQGQQTLTARWFAAGRVERMSALALTPALTMERQRLNGVEETIGFRLTPEMTLRVGHRARRGFGRPGFDHQAAVSLVWWKRWI